MANDLSQAPGGQRVLVVDDNDGVRKVLRRILESRGHLVTEADSADAALVVVAEDAAIDLVISDIRMPRRDGIWLLSELGRRYPDVGVLMISGDGDLDTAVKCLQAGALDFLSKPIVPAEVLARIDKALEKRQMAAVIRRFQRQYQADLEAQVHELSRKNQEMFLAQVQMAVRMLEARDPYTHGHSGRVAMYAVATARELGVQSNELEELRLGGELHDIGKIGVRDAVLHKAGPLTPDEFAEMRRHTIDGEAMLAVLRSDHPVVLDVVRSHHERLDGTGFPDGLAAGRISMPVRIVAVADAFDAMTSTRSYRGRESVEWAIDELKRESGSHFDPLVVDAFLAAHPDRDAMVRNPNSPPGEAG